MIALIGKCLRFLHTALICILVVIAVVCGAQKIAGKQNPMFLGWGCSVVLSGSMEPNIPTTSLVLIHDANQIEIGDVVTYINADNISVTHRVIEIEGDQIIVQGDANPVPDDPINRDQIVGKIEGFCSFLVFPAILIGFLILTIVVCAWPDSKTKRE